MMGQDQSQSEMKINILPSEKSIQTHNHCGHA